jgi:tripartite-type tricarboxylate transporter receptor subunit TctC
MKLPRRRLLQLAAAVAPPLILSRAVRAQTYPTRTVRFILPYGAASATDMNARLFADRLAVRWGKPVVVENRPGGDGLVSIAAFIAANDDHTLLFAPSGVFAVHPYDHEKLPYVSERDLLPIASISIVIVALSTPAALKLGSLEELVALARAQPGNLNAAAAAGISDFLLFGFLKNERLEVAKVPYRDIMQAPGDLAEGRIQILMTSLAVVQSLMQAGRLKVLAVTSRTRAPNAPDVPTVSEAGFPALELESPMGLFGPRGMAREVREHIAAEFKAVFDPVIAARLEATGQIIQMRGPAEFAAAIEGQRRKLAAIAGVLGIKQAQ